MNQEQRALEPPPRNEVRVVVDSVKDYAIFQLDVDGTVLTWNAGARDIKGYSDEEVIGTSFTRFYTREDQLAGRPWQMLNEAARAGRFEDEGWRVRKDGSRFWADVVISAVRDPGGQLTGFVKITRDLTERRAAEEATRRRARLHAVAAEIGLKALESPRLQQLFVYAAEAVASVLELDVTAVFELRSDDAMVLRAGFGWPEGMIGRASMPGAPFPDHARMPVAFSELADETDPFSVSLSREAGAVSGVVVPILGSTDAAPVYGALAACSRRPRVFDDDAKHFLLEVATLLAAAISRVRVSSALREAEHETIEERVARERAEDALSARDEFISVAAHELRTPLTSLQLKLQALERSLTFAPTEPGKLLPRVNGALRQVARLGNLVERLLDVARLSSQGLEMGFAEVDVGQLVRETADDFREQARAAGSSLTVHVETKASARWDHHRMVQAIANLLSNALKYGAGHPVVVRAWDDGSSCLIEVEDQGIGIPEDAVKRIFARFERAVSSRHYGGLGLGLYVTREIIEAHGGRASLERGRSQGACFRLEVPLRPETATRPQAS